MEATEARRGDCESEGEGMYAPFTPGPDGAGKFVMV